ncbi:unnamed protein product [Albugo candida]|uniref:GAF domain-containing protein n=2 Tax=Albugo candida TaxID=65357 RepID=A0A024GUU2_9STRA|nr:unnamed protein product [Albugo candida]|eukprot:CCI50368.1 unnamed protein product [Albugo candida]
MSAVSSMHASAVGNVKTPHTATKYGYLLNYDWKHPWPRAPVPTHEEERLSELYRYNILDSESDEKFDKLCRIACKEMKCPIAAISFIDKQKQWFKANSGLTQKQIPRDVALCAHTIMHPKRPLIVEDTSTDERFKNNPLVTRASAVRFYAGVPITTPAGHCIGSVFVFDVKVHQNVDAKILLKIAAKVLKYMEERMKITSKGNAPTQSEAESSLLRSDTNRGNECTTTGPTQNSQEQQPAGESTWRDQQTIPPETVQKPETTQSRPNTATATPTGSVGGVSPIMQGSTLAQTENAITATPAGTLEVGAGGNQGLGNMGTMLMNLLARTTETQQQLAAQQGVMFETLGQHSQQLDALGHSMMKLEQRFEQVRLKQASKTK